MVDLYLALSPRQQAMQIHGARLANPLFAMMENDQRWDAADAILSGQPLMLFSIQLGDPHARFQSACCLIEYRCHHFAWPTPRCPEIDQYRYLATTDLAFEADLIKREGVAGKQGLAADAADSTLGKAVCR